MKIRQRLEAAGNGKKTKGFGFVVCALLFTLCVSAYAQETKKVPRIGYLSAFDARREAGRAEVIRSALRDAGYVEGQNIAIEYRYAEGKQDQFPKLVAELVHLNVDIIMVFDGDILIHAAKSATKTIPIVMTGGGLNPVQAGLVESLARPGGNITGITNVSRKLGGKRLELLTRGRIVDNRDTGKFRNRFFAPNSR